jgi:Protein of unknown function (DUF4197)
LQFSRFLLPSVNLISVGNTVMRQRREILGLFLASTAVITLGGCASVGNMGGNAIAAVKKLLAMASSKALGKLGSKGGFATGLSANDLIASAGGSGLGAQVLQMAGSLGLLNTLDKKINSVAEIAANRAAPFIVDQIGGLSVGDANAILTGSDDAATQVLKAAISRKLADQLVPNLSSAVQSLGLLGDVNKILGLSSLGGMGSGGMGSGGLGLDKLVSTLTDKVGGGIFTAIGNEERAIRRDPASTGDAELIRLFGKRA